ncbi:MAG: flagellar biosynthesis protein FlhB [Oscillospiraceae bacterium]|jgi:flagellar biosynthetic protein FlhB
MAGGATGEKTEQATPKRKKDERKKGNVFSSKDLVTAFFIIFVFLTIKVFSKIMYQGLYQNMSYWIDIAGKMPELTTETITNIFLNSCKTVLLVAGPVLTVGVLIPIIFTGLQTRFIFSMEALKFKFSRLNPLEGIKKLFSLRSLVELIKSLMKIAIIASIIYDSLKDEFPKIISLTDVEIKASVVYLASAVFSTVMSIAIVFIFLGILDLVYQWWEYEKNLKMTKQEVKEEYKQMEGDPQIKSKIKQKQREMSQARMMQEVPKADVVIRNPTHFAVAIVYDPDKNRAPIVVAKGADRIALKIIEIAQENNINCTEDKPLARGLYDAVEIGQEIPEEFYHAVAEVLAFVYSLKNKTIY